jgi:hypothetical protein
VTVVRYSERSLVELWCLQGHGTALVIVDPGVEYEPPACPARTFLGVCGVPLRVKRVESLEPRGATS